MAARPRANRGKTFRLTCWNADGVRGRKLQLEQLLSEHGVHICLLNETHIEPGRALRSANFSPPDGQTGSWMRHGDPCPQGRRSLRGASLRIAVPGGYCHTLSVGDRTGEASVGLPLAHTTLERVGPDRASERGNPRPNDGRSQRETHRLEF
jgi:hypothetical protein